MRKILVIAGLLVAAPAFGQQIPPSPQDAQIQALMGKLSDEIQAGLQWRLAAIQAQARVKELEAELEKLKGAKH